MRIFFVLMLISWWACATEPSLIKPDHTLSFRIEAKQFVWRVQHPGADSQLDSVDDLFLENQIVLPEKTRAFFEIKSLDVLHGFWLPAKKLRLSLLPKKNYKKSVDFVKPGKHRLACSELCGAGHGRMMGWVTVLNKDKYAEWLADQIKPQ